MAVEREIEGWWCSGGGRSLVFSGSLCEALGGNLLVQLPRYCRKAYTM